VRVKFPLPLTPSRQGGESTGIAELVPSKMRNLLLRDCFVVRRLTDFLAMTEGGVIASEAWQSRRGIGKYRLSPWLGGIIYLDPENRHK